ncbi:enoyl-ACP reductase [Ammoniphilus sp. CFH 90114]|uniref:enoyl-ACP reductase FabI n=1 Tax=Ammoniphilus sp. CFH 90114 TaxID=2493665 RepID=UPI00100E8B31|nr:enoyl-ACP reductase [Ammoniphilus sp. CFH 90114]RXT08054.1 enoyl-ACP reductase [Ammoniphilus sp. CFH 90114]
MNKLLQGKKGLVLGVANEHSIAWHIAKKCWEEGAELASTYQNEKTLRFVQPLFESIGSKFYHEMDVTREDSVQVVMGKLREHFEGELDFIVHSVAGGPKKGELEGRFIQTSRQGFMDSMLISVFSLNVVLKETLDMLRNRDAAVMTVSYMGGERVVTNYNIMGVAKAALESNVRYLAADLGREGIRVNCLSPGTIKTRAASGIGAFNQLIEHTAAHSPLRRNATVDEVAKASLLLLSDWGSGITGETIYVDAGFHITGVDLPIEEEKDRG